MKFIAYIFVVSLLIGIGAGSLASGPYSVSNEFVLPIGDSVLICNSDGADRYHKWAKCYGYKRCTHDTLWVTLEEAVEKYERTPCKICYGSY